MGEPEHLAEMAEGVRAAVAVYTQALDDGRTDDLAATFCPDGATEMPGLGRHQGHQAPRRVDHQVTPTRPERHLVLTTLVTGYGDHEARATSDVVLLVKGSEGWPVPLVGRYHDVLHSDEGTWRFHSRVAEFS
jgi:hypothetical protein